MMLLLDMMRWNDNVLLPITSFKYSFFDGQVLMNYAMTLYSLTECQYNEPPLFQQMCENFINVHGRQIKAMVDAVDALETVNFTEHGFVRGVITDGSNSGHSTGNNETLVSAFNTSGYSPDSSGNSSAVSNGNYNEEKKENYTEKEKGTEVMKAIDTRKNLAEQNLYLKVLEWFTDELLCCVW